MGKAGRSDLLKWADDQLSPAIERVNKRYADRYGWGAASRLERDAAETGATPDNFLAQLSPAKSDAAGNERAGGQTKMKVADIEAVLKRTGGRLLKDSDPELFKAELEGGPSIQFLSRTSHPSEPKDSDLLSHDAVESSHLGHKN